MSLVMAPKRGNATERTWSMTNSNITCVNGILAGLYSVSWKTTNEFKDQVRVDATIDLTGCK